MEIHKTLQAVAMEIVFPPSPSFTEDLPAQVSRYELSPALFRELDVFGTKEPLLVCQIPDIPTMKLTQPPRGLEVVCPIGDPGNMGALLRCCRAFDVQTVILLKEAVHPFHPKVIRGSSGAVFGQHLHWGGSMSELNRPEILRWITALDVQGTDISGVVWPENVRLLIGEEGAGIPAFQFRARLCIPQNQPSIPLNAAVAGSIALYAYRRVFST